MEYFMWITQHENYGEVLVFYGEGCVERSWIKKMDE